MTVQVRTQKGAAVGLNVSRHEVARRLADRSLTQAEVDGRMAVLVDAKYRRMARKATA